jgi:hypothetical protein
LLLTRKLLNQGFLLEKLKSSLRTFYGRHHDLVNHGSVPLVVNTSRSFPHSRLITEFTRRAPLVEQEPLTLTISDCPFGIFKLFLRTTKNRVRSNYCRGMICCDV